MDTSENDIFRRTNRCDFIGPVYFGSSLDQTGLLNFFNSSSINITAFQAGNATAAVTYIWPTAGPAGNNYVLGSTTAGVLSWINAPGTYAPIGSNFVTIGADATLTNERALTGTASQIVVTDNGAGSTVVLSTPQNIATTSTPTFAGETLNGPLTVNDTTASAIRIQGSVNGVAPRVYSSNTNTTAGQLRTSVIGALGDNTGVEINLQAGKDTANNNIEMLGGTTKIQFGIAGVVQFTIDSSGILNNNISGNESTGAGSALLGANSPAVTLTAPYRWLKVKTSDGSTGYIPIWK